MNSFMRRQQVRGPSGPLAPPPVITSPDYPYIVGKQLYAAGGTDILVSVGYNYGNVSLQVSGDLDEDASLGATGSRHVIRCGNGGSKSPDGDPFQTGEFEEDYLQEFFDDQFAKCAFLGFNSSLAIDSNCYYNGKPGNELCIYQGQLDQTIFNNANLLAAALDRATQLAQRYAGQFLFFEPFVEPANGLTGVSDDMIKDRQEMVMDIFFQYNPHAIALIGGKGYLHSKIGSAYRVAGGGKEGWATKYPGKVMLTCNFLGAAISSGFLSTKFPALLAARDLHNVPVLPQQVGIELSSDPDSSLLGMALDACISERLGFFEWEKVASAQSSHGSWYTVGSGTSRAINAGRAAMVHSKFALANP